MITMMMMMMMMITMMMMMMMMIKLTLDFETNVNSNSQLEEGSYRPLLIDLNNDYRLVKFANLPIGCVGMFYQTSEYFLEMCLSRHGRTSSQCIITRICYRTYYCIFCSRMNHDQIKSAFVI